MTFFSNPELRNLNIKELKKHFLEVRSKINIGKSKNQEVIDLEVYICYVTKEIHERIIIN